MKLVNDLIWAWKNGEKSSILIALALFLLCVLGCVAVGLLG